MTELNFLWKARFMNDEILLQIDEQGNEHRYQEVKDRIEELKYFYLIKRDNTQKFIVDLINGFIYINKRKRNLFDDKPEKRNIRLIYFRRSQKPVIVGRSKHKIPKKELIKYFLGFQYNDSVGKNHKILLQIDNEGNIIIGD